MRISFSLFGIELGAVCVEPDETLIALAAVDEASGEELRLSTSDHSFGFSSDPLMPEYWEDEE